MVLLVVAFILGMQVFKHQQKFIDDYGTLPATLCNACGIQIFARRRVFERRVGEEQRGAAEAEHCSEREASLQVCAWEGKADTISSRS